MFEEFDALILIIICLLASAFIRDENKKKILLFAVSALATLHGSLAKNINEKSATDDFLDHLKCFDEITRESITPGNRPIKFLFQDGGIFGDTKYQEFYRDTMRVIKEEPGKLSDEITNKYLIPPLQKFIAQMQNESPDLYTEKMQNVLIKIFGHWIDALSAALYGLKMETGTCGSMAATNAMQILCHAKELHKLTIITVENDKNTKHTFLAVDCSQKLIKKIANGKKTSSEKKCKILDSYSSSNGHTKQDQWSKESKVFSPEEIPALLTNIKWKKVTVKPIGIEKQLEELNLDKTMHDKIKTFITNTMQTAINAIEIGWPDLNDVFKEKLGCNSLSCTIR